MNKQTAVEYLIEVLRVNAGIKVSKQLQEEVLKMEKEQSQNYAIFAIRCDRTEMRILEFNDYIKLEENEKQKLTKDIALIVVAAGGLLTLAFAIYFIVDTLKKWY
jgi:hypothetical protein